MSRTIILACCLLVWLPGLRAASPPSFVQDVIPVFTRLGCNQGACHGKGVGQNGFRLSLRGYAPELDHASLTREFFARRITLAHPESSPLLRKAAGFAAHEGGKLMSRGDRAYETILDWIRAGAPGPKQGEPQLTTLEVYPSTLLARPGQTDRLRVLATSSDGTQRDVTWLCKFESGDSGLASVDAHGTIHVKRPGETAIRVAFQTLVHTVVVTVPFDRRIEPSRLAGGHNFIDKHVFTKLDALRIEPSDLSSDPEFLRRAYLDTLGILPTPAEVRAFLADPRHDRRKILIGELLRRPEFADHWAVFLGDLFQNRKERDHDVRGAKGVQSFHAWLLQQIATNRPWNQIARQVLLAEGTSNDQPAVGYYIVTVGEHSDPTRSEVVDSVSQAFLGIRIGCARCHNHPQERYTQDDFYHFAGFFSRIKLERQEPKKGPTTLRLAGIGGKEPHLAKQKVGVHQPRTGQFLEPRHLDRSVVGTLSPGEDPRIPLVNWITSPKNPYFTGAILNRLWKHYLGVGLIEPVDDLRPSNPPTNPQLFEALQTEFVRSGFDLKHMMQLILESRTYQLSSATRPRNITDNRFYSHYLARRLPAEVLLDAIATATEVPDKFPGYPVGIRAAQIPDPGTKSYFLTLFGRSERVSACACERSGEVTMPQLLHLQNGESVMDKIRSPRGRLARLMKEKKNDEAIVEELFLATVSRLPSEANRAVVKRAMTDSADREEVMRDLFWALLNSKEFAFVH